MTAGRGRPWPSPPAPKQPTAEELKAAREKTDASKPVRIPRQP